MFLIMNVTMAFDGNKESYTKKSAVPEETENKLSEEEITRLNEPVEENLNMDKSGMRNKEKKELTTELSAIKMNAVSSGGTVYIGGASLLLIIIIILILI